jgi:hypothetical protein
MIGHVIDRHPIFNGGKGIFFRRKMEMFRFQDLGLEPQCEIVLHSFPNPLFSLHSTQREFHNNDGTSGPPFGLFNSQSHVRPVKTTPKMMTFLHRGPSHGPFNIIAK